MNKLCDNVPVVLSGNNIDFVHETKYLGVIKKFEYVDMYMYCCPLWFNSTSSTIKKLKTSYNSALRNLLLIKKPYSASTMFVAHGIPSFRELLRTSIYRFADRVSKNSNSIIMACMTPIVYIHSPIWQWWRSVLC